MIRITLGTAEIRKPAGSLPWRVISPESGHILAYCDTEEECVQLVAFFSVLNRMLGCEP